MSARRRTTRRRQRTVFSQYSFWFATLAVLGVYWLYLKAVGRA